MFIDFWALLRYFAPAERNVFRRAQPPVHCAPLEPQTAPGSEVYKHLAPPEPEHLLR